MHMLGTPTQRLWSIVLLCSLCAAQDETARVRANCTSSLSAPTCPSTSINYITHTLPQQCLRTGYTPPAVAANDSAASTILTTPALPKTPLTTSANTTTSSPNTTTIVTTTSSSSLPTNNDTLLLSAIETITSSATPTVIPDTTEAESENDSALDTAKFLSFEDWKNQNLAKAGQSAENVGPRGGAASGKERKRPENSNGLETFGEDAEIDIDFGFGGAPSTVSGVSDRGQDAGGTTTGPASESKASAPTLRNKDAGKTCKERFNYASFDCAANILKTNARSKSPNSVLVENKDSYMLNECSIDNKFLIVELCDDILVDTIVLANFEFFSSMFRTFRISVSDRYPVKAEKWKDLGTFEARNSRDIQAFLVENPLIWARYLRVEFLTHYGSEYYCPVSLLRIHGTTMMEEFRHQEQLSRGEVDDDDEDEEVSEYTAQAVVPVKAEPTPVIVEEKTVASAELSGPSVVAGSTISTAKTANLTVSATIAAAAMSTSSPVLNGTGLVELEAVTVTESATATVYYRASRPAETASSTTLNTTSTPMNKAAMNTTTSTISMTSGINSTLTSSTITTQSAPKVLQNTTSIPASSTLVSSSAASSSTTTSTVPASSTPPATQESFFKSVHKRLNSLESNATLSLQYIESQSALLRDAFASASKRQLSRTTTFLDTLNTTISSELLRFKSEYEQLWQSTVLELSNQREEGRREREVLAEHVRLLAEEVVSQKRIVAGQAGLMLLCLGFLVFGQLGMGTPFGVSVASPSIYGKNRSSKSHAYSQASSRHLGMSRSDSPADGVNDSAPDSANASAIGSTAAGVPSRHWRQRWRWDSPFRSSVNSGAPEHYASGSSPKQWKPLPEQRRVRSENDGRLLHERMQAMSMDEDEEYEDGAGMLSPTSPGTASVTSGLDAVSEGDIEIDVNDHAETSDGIASPQDDDGGITPIIETGDMSGGDREQVLQVQSAPTTPMA